MNQTQTAQLPQGPIRYRDLGPADGAPIVFVHGYLVDSRLWDGPAERLSKDHRCLLADWPMGSHRVPMNADADLTPPGVARIIADFIEALDLHDVTIVGNDSGGAISQVLVTRHPERIGRLVLTNCDTREHFPPAPFTLMPRLARIPGAMTAMGLPFRIPALRRRAFAAFTKHEIPDELTASWMEPSQSDRGIQRDARKFTIGLDKRHTLEAARRLPEFLAPTLFAWAPEDRFFKLSHARELAAIIPDSRIVEIPDAKTFVALDQPERLTETIAAFMRETAPAPVGSAV